MMEKRCKIQIACGAAMAALALLLRFGAPMKPGLVERYFARGIYPFFSSLLSRVNGLLPISFFEYGICVLILIVLVWAIRALICALRRPVALKRFWTRSLSALALLAGIASLWYLMGGGLNYFRYSFASCSGLEIRESSKEELIGLCSDLAEQANLLAAQVERDETGAMVLQQDFEGTCGQLRQGYWALQNSYGGVLRRGTEIRPKAVAMSEVMSICRITGLYSFYTCEANIDVHQPDYSIPYTIAHETAHYCGFMREDEANYIAYVVCRASDSAEAQYSGTMLALIHSTNALAGIDPEAWLEVRSGFSDEVRRELALNSAYWQKYETSVGRAAEKVNDVHLKMNNQESGLQSYGRMVDLLLADWRDGGL